jgi:signal transduction histidine kinase
MTESRWWTAAVLAAVVVLSVLVFLEQPPITNLVGSLVSLGIFLVFWLVLGVRAMREPRVGLAVVIAIGLVTCAAVYFEASMATLQCVVYPIIWTILERVRLAVIANVVFTSAIAVAMFLGLGATTEALAVAGSIEGLSLLFSLGLGLWISNISDQSKERKKLIDELESAQAQLAALSKDAGAAEERERLAREIHDTIAQDLTGLVLTAQRGRRELSKGNSAAVEKQLAVLEENARHALVETRALVASGAAVGVDGGGLAVALRRLAERFERETGIVVTVSADEAASADRDAEVVLLRCAQEALANVRKHSAAGTAAVALTAHDGEIDLRISDDGAGFDPARPSSGFGLTGLRERLALVRGTLAVVAEPGGGTTLVATLPQSTGLTA